MIKLLYVGDFVAQTGFGRVAESIFKYLPEDKYDIDILAVNYFGDPHNLPYRVYPATLGGDQLGMGRLPAVLNGINPDLIFLLGDIWNTDQYLKIIKEQYKGKTLPKIVIYFPVDAKEHVSQWYENLDIVTPVVYTRFGYEVAKKAAPEFEYKIIPHGIDSEDFYRMEGTRAELKKKLYPDSEEFYDSFMVLSAQRNQPRKRIELAMQAFALFAKGKPENVKLHMHCGVTDEAVNVDVLAKRYGIDKRTVLSTKTPGLQQVSKSILNLIYNATEVGVNSSLGEGFGLPNAEQAACGIPQVVPDHSALHDLYEDCGILVPTVMDWTLDKVMTVGRVVSVEDMAIALDRLYKNRDLYNLLAEKSFYKFNSKEFSWKYISSQWDQLFSEVL